MFWKQLADGSWASPFWKWLNILDLNQPPKLPFGWLPDRYLPWWRASRVLQDYDLTGSAREIIDEFPQFSYLLADLPPHLLAMPFILLSGWLLSGVESSPGDVALAAQAASMLALGFAFLLAVFPLYNWTPLLLEEAPPFKVGFLLWILPTMTIIFGTGFLDRYSWLRSSPQAASALQVAGLLMIVTSGFWAATQRHLGRIMAYGSIAESGFAILALSLNSRVGVSILFLLLPARALSLAVWSLALTIFKNNGETLRFGAVRGLSRRLRRRGASGGTCRERLVHSSPKRLR